MVSKPSRMSLVAVAAFATIANHGVAALAFNGDFEQLDAAGAPIGWKLNPAGAKVAEANGNHFLRVTNEDANARVTAEAILPLNPQWQALLVSVRLRGKGIRPGPVVWMNGHLGYIYVDAAGARVGDYPAAPMIRADTDWKTITVKSAVPKGAVALKLDATLDRCVGVLDVDDIAIHAIERDDLEGVNAWPAPHPLPAHPGNGFTPGDFETPDAGTGWKFNDAQRIQILDEGGNHFLRLTSLKPNLIIQAVHSMPLDPAWQRFVVRVRMRAAGVRVGANPTDQPELTLRFRDAAGHLVGRPQENPALRRETDWVAIESTLHRPAGATTIEVIPSIAHAVGVIDFDDIQIIGESITPSPSLQAGAIALGPEGTKVDFEMLDATGMPAGWHRDDATHATVIEENGDHFVRLTNADPNATVTVGYTTYTLDPAWHTVRLRARLRAKDLKQGAEQWQTARLVCACVDASGEMVGPWLPAPTLHKDTDWTTMTTQFDLPVGATYLQLSAHLLNATGTMDIDDVVIEPVLR